MLIEAPELSSYPSIRHGFFTRQGGVSEGLHASLNGGLGSSDRPERVAENRARMAERLGVAPGALLGLYQVHSAEVVTVRKPWTVDGRPRADAMVTDRPDIALGIATADCGPILFADAHRGVIGAAHAGWRGALSGVIEATLAAMETLGARRDRIVAVLGPTISRPAYEVGPEFQARFLEADADNGRFFAPAERAGHSLFDLPAYIATRLSAAGIAQHGDLGLCTYADEARFYSYRRATHRREADYGRLISAIALTR